MDIGSFVEVRSRPWLVEALSEENGLSTARLSCIADDAQGEQLEILVGAELDARRLPGDDWESVGARGLDPQDALGAYLRVVRWNSATAAERDLLQAPFRAGIRLRFGIRSLRCFRLIHSCFPGE